MSGRRPLSQTDSAKQSFLNTIKLLEDHRYGAVFAKNVTEAEAPGYSNCVLQSVSIAALKEDVMNGTITDPVSLNRKIAIMHMNATMFNSSISIYSKHSKEMHKDTSTMMMEKDETHGTRKRVAFAKNAVLRTIDAPMEMAEAPDTSSTGDVVVKEEEAVAAPTQSGSRKRKEPTPRGKAVLRTSDAPMEMTEAPATSSIGDVIVKEEEAVAAPKQSESRKRKAPGNTAPRKRTPPESAEASAGSNLYISRADIDVNSEFFIPSNETRSTLKRNIRMRI